jgi:hypothetical protein
MARKLPLLVVAFALLAPAAPAAAADCAKLERKAERHAKKARGADKKAMALRNADSAEEKQRFRRYRRLTRKHARAQARFNRRFEKCKVKKLRGSYAGALEGTGLPLSFIVSRDVESITGFRAQVELECTTRGSAGSTTRVEELVLDAPIELDESGHFQAEQEGTPAYFISGRVRDGEARGSIRYATGTPFEGEYCRSESTPWSAARANNS